MTKLRSAASSPTTLHAQQSSQCKDTTAHASNSAGRPRRRLLPLKLFVVRRRRYPLLTQLAGLSGRVLHIHISLPPPAITGLPLCNACIRPSITVLCIACRRAIVRCSLHAWSRSLCLGLWGGSEADKRLTVTASHRPARRPRTSPRRHHQYHRTQKPEYIHAARAPRRRSRRSIARVSFHVNPAGTPRSRARARETEGVGDRIDVTRRHLNWLGARRRRHTGGDQ